MKDCLNHVTHPCESRRRSIASNIFNSAGTVEQMKRIKPSFVMGYDQGVCHVYNDLSYIMFDRNGGAGYTNETWKGADRLTGVYGGVNNDL